MSSGEVISDQVRSDERPGQVGSVQLVHLEHGEQRHGEAVEVGRRRALVEVPLSAEQLHAEQREDEDEEEQQEQQRYDGAHRAEQRDDQVPQRRPVPEAGRQSLQTLLPSIINTHSAKHHHRNVHLRSGN